MFNVSQRTIPLLQDCGYAFFSVSNKKKRADTLALLKVSPSYSRVIKLVRPT